MIHPALYAAGLAALATFAVFAVTLSARWLIAEVRRER